MLDTAELLMIETCDKGAFCGAWGNVEYQLLSNMPLREVDIIE